MKVFLHLQKFVYIFLRMNFQEPNDHCGIGWCNNCTNGNIQKFMKTFIVENVIKKKFYQILNKLI